MWPNMGPCFVYLHCWGPELESLVHGIPMIADTDTWSPLHNTSHVAKYGDQKKSPSGEHTVQYSMYV
jgi:hypothetical protein